MNYIIIAVAMIVVFIMIFVAFSSDDREEDIGYLEGEDIAKPKDDNSVESTGKPEVVASEETTEETNSLANDESSDNVVAIEDGSSMFQQVSDTDDNAQQEIQQVQKPAEITRIHPINRPQQEIPLLEVGSEEDLRLRLNLKHNLASPTAITKSKCVAAVIQLRFPEDVIKNSPDFVNVLAHAEKIFEEDFSFEFATYQAYQSYRGPQVTHVNRIWIFEPSEGKNVVVEALIDAYEATIRFRQALEKDAVLRDNKVKIAIGLSAGEMSFVNRGVNTEPTMFGMPVYMAESLVEVISDFGIYVDANIHEVALPLFDFREWKPTVIRQTLPAIPLYELVGWNKPEEIASYVKHEEPEARKTIAIAYRYFELTDMHPLIELMSDKDMGVVKEAVETISFLHSDTMNGTLKLKLPDMTDPDIRSKIIEAFGNAGNDSVIPLVMASTHESSWKVRLAATKSLYQLGGKEILPKLEIMLKDPDSIVRVAANYIYYKETKKPEYFDVLIEYLSDASKRARATAVDYLMEIGTDRALKEITGAFGNQELDLQKHILSVMLGSKSKILYQCFLTMFKNANEGLRAYIVEAVRRAGIVS